MPLPTWALRYLQEIEEEYARIGFTRIELLHKAAGGEPDEDAMKREVEHLRSFPTGIGAEEYYRREGLNFEPLRQAVAEYKELTGHSE